MLRNNDLQTRRKGDCKSNGKVAKKGSAKKKWRRTRIAGFTAMF
nr:MAG TPA: hypothetical protein [Microviridae sp.]